MEWGGVGEIEFSASRFERVICTSPNGTAVLSQQREGDMTYQ